MNLKNIISAGRMMAIVVALLGAFHCGASVALGRDGMAWEIGLGAVVTACGLALVVMIPVSDRHSRLATAVLAVGILMVLLGVAAVVLAWDDPSSWMMAIVSFAIFIDTLCLRISVSS